MQQQLQQTSVNNEAQKQLEKLQQDFQQMQIGYHNSLAKREKQFRVMQEMHKDDPKLTEFVTESISLNDQLLQQQETLCQRISQWRSYCETSNRITNQVVDLRHDYDLIDRRVTEYLGWQETEEGENAGTPIINDTHKEMLFNKWDAQIRKAEQAAEEAATVENNVIECINENLHRANLISKTTPGYLPNVQHLQTSWRQKAQERAESIQRLTKLSWESYWTYLVKPHSQCMTLKCIINSTEKMAPALTDPIFTGQLNSEVGQPTLLKQMLNACDYKEQIHR